MGRYVLHSPYDVPLPLDAVDAWHALRLGLTVLGREALLVRAQFDHRGGRVFAVDPDNGDEVVVETVSFEAA